MNSSRADQITQIISQPDLEHTAAERLMPLVYDEFRSLAAAYLRREHGGHTLQPTALVHEMFMKLVDQTRVHWRGRTHFFAVGAQIMRRILVDHARKRGAMKRGGGGLRIELDDAQLQVKHKQEDVLALEDALEKLSVISPRQAQMVELRFYGGMSFEEIAEVLQVSKRTVEREWTLVRAWLRRELSENGDS